MAVISASSFIPEIITRYGLTAEDFRIETVGSGYIHHTFKLSGKNNFILQRINKNVFRQPEVIASNLRTATDYLKKRFPDFIFPSVIQAQSGAEMIYDAEGYPWRLYPYFENTFTVDRVSSENEAYSAASEFGRLTRYLDQIDIHLFKPTIERFHDLAWRYDQFETALANATANRLLQASEEIDKAKEFKYLVDQYAELLQTGTLRLRITHNDTKINNILFDSTTGKAVCAIDLDTLMPGYFIYDLGDMIRTFVPPTAEEEKDLNKILVRENIYRAVVRGYLSQMNDCISSEEKLAVPFSGMMMTYIMALRILADFLNGDVYYKTNYEGQNLFRARNQFRYLEKLKAFNQRGFE